MEITIYSKKRQTRDGKKTFYNYFSTLRRKSDGSELRVSVKFREDCGSPKGEECPQNIIIEKGNANLSKKELMREDTGEMYEVHTLWINAWRPGAPFEDHSLDDFE